jgi:putative PEP-CTERM system TPR-repeat lipoprotein
MAGEAYMQLKQPARAAEYFSRAVATEPKSPGLRAKLGMAHLAAGETERAIKELESAVELTSGPSHADTALVLTLLGAEQYDRALAAALKLQKNPNNPVALNLLGAAYMGKKDEANARKSFESALARQPGYPPAVMNLAQLDLAAKNYESARTRFKSILAKDPKSVSAMVGLSKLESALGNLKGAVSWLEKAHAENPREVEVGVFLANHYLKVGEARKALALASALKTTHPDHLDVLSVLGQAQFDSGATTSALATYKILAAKLPGSPTAHYRLASAEMATENYTAATESLNRALRLKPDYPEAQTALALLEFRAGKHLASIKLAQQLQERHPKLATGYSLEGDNLVAQRKFAAAEKSYEKAFNIAKSGTLAVKWHAASMSAGNSRQADARLHQWLKDNPNDLASQLYLANHYVNSGSNKAAIEVYESVLRKDTKNVPALNNLASLYHREKDPRALRYFEQAYQLMPDNAAIADNLGWLLLEQGKIARGVEVLRRATILAPQNRQIRYHLAVALAKSGDEAQAAEELEKLLAKGDKFAQREEAQALLKQLHR